MLRDLCGDVGMLVYWCMSILNANENEILNIRGESLRNMGNPTTTRRGGGYIIV